MRLIDADSLLGKAIEEKRFVFLYEDMMNQEFVVETVYCDLAEFISSAPTIEAEPIRHGRWKEHGYKWQCSSCRILMNIDGTPKENLLNYCANCGAKMDLEASDG